MTKDICSREAWMEMTKHSKDIKIYVTDVNMHTGKTDNDT